MNQSIPLIDTILFYNLIQKFKSDIIVAEEVLCNLDPEIYKTVLGILIIEERVLLLISCIIEVISIRTVQV